MEIEYNLNAEQILKLKSQKFCAYSSQIVRAHGVLTIVLTLLFIIENMNSNSLLALIICAGSTFLLGVFLILLGTEGIKKQKKQITKSIISFLVHLVVFSSIVIFLLVKLIIENQKSDTDICICIVAVLASVIVILDYLKIYISSFFLLITLVEHRRKLNIKVIDKNNHIRI